MKQSLDRLKDIFAKYTGALTAFSGGVDSALVLYLSRKYLGRNNSVGVISKSESLKSSDYEIAKKFADQHDIQLLTIKTEELTDQNYSENPSSRCYFCKTHLYNSLKGIIADYPGFVALNGTNTDDIGDYRPGLKAAEEFLIKSPLLEAGLDKSEVRKIAKYFGLAVWDKPASPCMSSRIPYGQHITKLKLDQIEQAEALLSKLGFLENRVRHLGSHCSIEVPQKHVSMLNVYTNYLLVEMQRLGFTTCTIDQEGLISGKLNGVLNNG